MRKPVQVFLLFLLAHLSNCTRSLEPVITVTSGNVSVVLASEGGLLKSGSNKIELRLHSGAPQRIENPSLLLYMPAMGTMPEMRSKADLSPSGPPGHFKGNIDLGMKGTWQGLVEFSAGQDRRSADLSVQVE